MPAMTYATLSGAKSASGSIASWCNYAKLDVPTIIAEAESLIYTALRVREMRSEWTFVVRAGASMAKLPARFLDPIGHLFDITNGSFIRQMDQSELRRSRFYDSTTFTAKPISVALTNNSSAAIVTMAGLVAPAGSVLTLTGAPAQSDVDINQAFKAIASSVGASTVDTGQIATSTRTVSFTGDLALEALTPGYPTQWAMFEEALQLDFAAQADTRYQLACYKAPAPLSSANPSNWLLDRYPKLMRLACQAAAADMMKDDTEYQKHSSAMSAYAGVVMVNDDLSYRGAEITTEVP